MNKFRNYLATFGGLLALVCACAFSATAKVNQTFSPINFPGAIFTKPPTSTQTATSTVSSTATC